MSFLRLSLITLLVIHFTSSVFAMNAPAQPASSLVKTVRMEVSGTLFETIKVDVKIHVDLPAHITTDIEKQAYYNERKASIHAQLQHMVSAFEQEKGKLSFVGLELKASKPHQLLFYPAHNKLTVIRNALKNISVSNDLVDIHSRVDCILKPGQPLTLADKEMVHITELLTKKTYIVALDSLQSHYPYNDICDYDTHEGTLFRQNGMTMIQKYIEGIRAGKNPSELPNVQAYIEITQREDLKKIVGFYMRTKDILDVD